MSDSERTNLHARVDSRTPKIVKDIAKRLGLTYADEGSIGRLLDEIASGGLEIVRRKKKK